MRDYMRRTHFFHCIPGHHVFNPLSRISLRDWWLRLEISGAFLLGCAVTNVGTGSSVCRLGFYDGELWPRGWEGVSAWRLSFAYNYSPPGFELTSASVHVQSVSSKWRLRMTGLERLGPLFGHRLFLLAAPCGGGATVTSNGTDFLFV